MRKDAMAVEAIALSDLPPWGGRMPEGWQAHTLVATGALGPVEVDGKRTMHRDVCLTSAAQGFRLPNGDRHLSAADNNWPLQGSLPDGWAHACYRLWAQPDPLVSARDMLVLLRSAVVRVHLSERVVLEAPLAQLGPAVELRTMEMVSWDTVMRDVGFSIREFAGGAWMQPEAGARVMFVIPPRVVVGVYVQLGGGADLSQACEVRVGLAGIRRVPLV